MKTTIAKAPWIIVFLLLNVTQVSVAQTLVYSEYFSLPDLPAGWVEANSPEISPNIWTISESSNANGMAYELKVSADPGYGITRMILPPLNTLAMSSLTLHFNHMFLDNQAGCYLKIQSSYDGLNWYDEPWVQYSGYGNIGPEIVLAPITWLTPGDLYISLTVEGDLTGFDSWYIDNVELWADLIYPVCPGILSPVDQATGVLSNVTLTWDYTWDAEGYYLFLGTDNPPTNVLNGIDVGFIFSYPVTGLNTNTDYYWSVVPYNSNMAPANCDVFSFTTIVPIELPYNEMITSDIFPEGWSQESYQPYPLWSVSGSNYAGGDYNEFASSYAEGIGITRLISPPINSAGLSQLYLTFNHFFIDYASGLNCKIQTSTDMINWHDVGWSISSGNGNIGPEQVSIQLIQDVGDVTYFAFVFEGDHYTFYNWFIDNVMLDVTGSLPGCPNLVSPEDNSIQFLADYTFYWDHSALTDGYLLSLGTDNPPLNMLDHQDIGFTDSILINNLEIGQTYYWSVLPYNSFGSPESCTVWSFTIPGPVNSFPWVENFDGSGVLPPGWVTEGTNPWFIEDSSYYGPFHHHGAGAGNYAMVKDWILYDAPPSLLLSPPLDLTTLDHPKLKFFYQIGNQYHYESICYLYVDVWNGNEWIESVAGPLSNNNHWEPVIIDLGPYINDNLKIRFKGIEDPLDLVADIAIDDVMVFDSVIIPQCPEKYLFDTTDLQHLLTTFSWHEVPITNGYLFYLGTDNPPSNIINGMPIDNESDIFDIVSFQSVLPSWNTHYYWNVASFTHEDTVFCDAGVVKTMADPLHDLPYEEPFPPSLIDFPEGWIDLSKDYNWYLENSNSAGGAANELVAYGSWDPIIDTARMVMLPLNSVGYNSIWLTFKSLISSYSENLIFKIQTSSDLINWTDEGFYRTGISGYDGPEDVRVRINQNVNGITWIAFVIKGDLFDLDMWSIDNISVFPVYDHDVSTIYARPGNNFYSGWDYDPWVWVFNYGNSTESFVVTMDDQQGYLSAITVNDLDPGEIRKIDFDPWTVDEGDYQLMIYSSLQTDQWLFNDTVVYHLTVYRARWEDGDSMPDAGFMGSGVAWQDSYNQAYLFAVGGGSGSTTNQFRRYDVLMDSWEELPPLPFSSVGPATAVVGTDLYVIAGGPDEWIYTDSVRKYNIPSAAWSTVAPYPLVVSNAKAVSYQDSLIYVAGGYSNFTVTDKIYLYNTNTNTWREATPLPAPRFVGAFACNGGKLIYAGGVSSAGIMSTTYIGQIDSLNHSIIHWQQLSDAPAPVNIKDSWAIATSFGEERQLIPENVFIPNAETVNPAGGMMRWDAAPWGEDGFIITTGSFSLFWEPANPNPCYVYHLSTDTWEKMPDLPVPVVSSFYGSFSLADDTWKLVVASGYDGWGEYPGTQILTDTLSAPAGYGTVSGTLTYDNSASTPLNACTVELLSGSDVVQSAVTTNGGQFFFTNVLPGSFSIRVSSNNTWGGGNAVDALQIMRHFVGSTTLTGLRLSAADVDNSASINAVDALAVMRRFVGMISTFNAGNWVFEIPAINVNAGDTITVNIKGICYGDVDGSFNP
ncbi:MAG: kelch repeat-containing protein [Bacteroidales bacterium]